MTRNKRSSCGYSPRKVGTKEPKQRFLIVCEGQKTEPNYFKSFRVPRDVVEIDVKGLRKNPSKLVDKAKEFSNQGDYDQVWCVFDRDDWTSNDFNGAIKKAEGQGFKVAYANEAFELWYVLHFEFLNTGIRRSNYCQKLIKFLGKYEKNSEDMYDRLLENQNTAIKNAKKLFNQYNPHNPSKDNPCTTVHLLVQELNKFVS